MRKKMITALLCLSCLCMFCGCEKKDSFVEEVSTEYGQDYKDGREKKWNFENAKGKKAATITASEGYKLKNQTDFSCAIVEEESGTSIAGISWCAGRSANELVKDIQSTKQGQGEVSVEESEEYTVIHVSENGVITDYYVVGDEEDSLYFTLLSPSEEELVLSMIRMR